MTKKILILFKVICLILFIKNYTFAQSNILGVVPQPQEYKFNDEKFMLGNSIIIYQIFCDNNEQVNIVFDELKKELQNQNEPLEGFEKSNLNIYAGLPTENKSYKELLIKYNLLPSQKLGDEGYNLLIDSKNVFISANNHKGLFYGIQTLKQIVRGSNSEYLNGVKISDWPDYKYRAVSDDISRGPIPTIDFMKYQIRRFSEMKINTLIHYVEHVVKTKKHPEFAPVDGSLTIEQWKEISDYAKKYNIMVIGGFQSFGHFNRILETPEYAHLGESGTLISPVKEESYKFLEDIYSEMIPAFDSPFFNINCDETFDLGKEDSKLLVDSIGYDGVYYQHIMKLYNIVKKYNKRIIMWGDILLEYPNLLKKLPKDIIIGTWTYDPKDNFDDYITPIKNEGFEFWVVPGVLNSYRLFPNYHQAPTNIKNFSADGLKYKASGLLNCVWDDGGSTLFTNAWYGVSYGADKSWNVKSNDDNFDNRFNLGIYAAANNSLTDAIHKLTEFAYLEPTDGMFDKVLFAKTLPDSGKNIRISLDQWDRVLTIVNETEKILSISNTKNYSDDIEYLHYVVKLYRTLANERINLLKSAELYSRAEELFVVDQFKARKNVLSAYQLISDIIEDIKSLKDTFEILWLNENHTYALDWTSDKYINKLEQYIDVKNRLFASLKKIDSSEQISTKGDTRLDIAKLPGKYFREWMMVNPIIKKGEGDISHIDYLADMGGEENAEPKVTQEFYYDSYKYRWRRVVSENQDIVDLKGIFSEENRNVVMYAFANVTTVSDTTISVLAGSTEGIEVFINGKSIFSDSGSGKLIPDEFSFSASLSKGKNNLLIKITQTTGDWGFTFRLPDCEVRNSKNRYKIITHNEN